MTICRNLWSSSEVLHAGSVLSALRPGWIQVGHVGYRSFRTAPALNVLLAEDNPVNQEVAMGLLETLDCAVTVVENGEEAVDAAAGGGFDLVLMDCQMPVMDGLDATRAIRNASIGEERLPIIALTAEVLDDVKTACLDAGMDDLLGKPFSRQDMQNLLQRWRPALATEAAIIPEATAAAPAATSIDLKPIETLRALDPGNERGLVGRAIDKFVDYSDELMSHFSEAVDRADITEISRIAHSLKSSSANLGATTVSCQCAEIEKLTADDSLPSDIETRMRDLQAAVRTAQQDLLVVAEGG